MASRSKSKGRGRQRSRAEDSTGKKAAAVEVRKGSDVVQETLKLPAKSKIRKHVEIVEEVNGKIATLTAKRRLAYKSAKAEGVATATINHAIALKRGDSEEFKRQYMEDALALEEFGATFRITVSDTMFKDAVAQATAEGRARGASGKAPESRWAEDSNEHKAYIAAYTKATAGNVKVGKDAKNGAAAKPPRKGANGNGKYAEDDASDDRDDKGAGGAMPQKSEGDLLSQATH